MDRRPTSSHVSWILLPVAAYLAIAALSLPRQAYTGLALRGNLVAAVDPGSPGQRAGLRAGDRLFSRASPQQAQPLHDPLQRALPGEPVTLTRVRGGQSQPVWLAPESLPAGERRLLGGLLVVASVFVMLGGWVWSERRDGLTRAFFLLCVGFGALLVPFPPLAGRVGLTLADLLRTGVSLYLPALFVHFFGTFPESSPRGRRRQWIRAAYSIATALFVLALGTTAYERVSPGWSHAVEEGLQVGAAIWFAVGLFSAIALFIGSYLHAGSADARRRLLVALLGTSLGLLPFGALIAVRNVSPGTALPGERWAVALTLLVPASFAWAIVVHRVFDFRVALRAAVVTLLVAAACATVYVLGEWWAGPSSAGAGADVAGGALAVVALIGSLAGPAAPALRSLGVRLVPDDETPPLAAWLHDHTGSPDVGGAVDGESLLADACAAVTRYLRLDGCAALAVRGAEVSVVRGSRTGAMPEPGPALRARAMRVDRGGIQSLDDAPLGRSDRAALKLAGVAWLLPVGDPPARAMLLLGRRMAGTWLSQREALELDRFARQLGIALENANLRREASSHDALTRDLREARRVQAHLLPQRVPVHPTLDCAAAVLSSEPVGGDYYDFVEGPDRSFTLAVGDVAGHGLSAALLLSHVQAHFRGLAGGDLTPARILGALNRELVEFDQPQKFVALVCARVDVRHGRVLVANAGLMPPLVRRRRGAIEQVDAGGVLLGVQRDSTYSDVSLELGSGDSLVVYTDGLTEAQRGDELYGAERLKTLLGSNGARRAVDLLGTLLREVRAFADRPLDDLTVVVLRQLT